MLILAKINEIGDMMGLMIYNSLTNKIEEFKTHEPGIVNMYVCGPTVYDYIHIGNARPVIFYDMLKNYLEYMGYKVNYASNITDVDDKIINKALEQGVSEEEIAKKYNLEFLYRDFRPGFREGQARARELGLYMQKYCGCVFSEEDRYSKQIMKD